MATRQEIREAEKSMSSALLEVVGPGLIMLMVGSLVFFLIEIFYRGPHTGRLCWVFGLFTFASVLVSRVSIQSGINRGRAFGLALGLAAFITSFTLVEFEGAMGIVMEPILLTVFIAVVMWSASKLTWDCTVIDKSRDSSATGITELVRRKWRRENGAEEAGNAGTIEAANSEEASDVQAGNLIKAFFSGSQRKNTPGIWVFYFAMAALPIFGIGQWFVTPDLNSGYFYVVLLFGIYLSAALALMMTTSLLGLQRYLRKRNTHMPPEVARDWMMIGTVVSIAVMALVLLFPRPNATGSIANGLKWFTSAKRDSSEMALGKDGTQEKQSGRGEKSSEQGKKSSGSAKTEQTSGSSESGRKTQGGGKGKGGKNSSSSSSSQKSQNSSQQSKQKSGESSKQNSGEPSGGQKGGEQQKSAEGQSEGDQKQSQDSDSKGEQDGGGQRKSKVPDHMRPDKSAAEKRRKEAEAEKRNQENENQGKGSNQNESKNSSQPNSDRQSSSPPPSAPKAPSMQALSQIATLITYAIVAVAAVVLFFMFRKEIMEAIRGLIDELKRLFAGKPQEGEAAASESRGTPTPVRKLKPFSSFVNPFKSGRDSSLSPDKVVERTFLALEAWAFERGLERPSDQTPHEFAAALKKLNAAVGVASVGLCNSLCKNLFGQGKVSSDELGPLKELWDLMENAQEETAVPIAFAN